MLSSYQEAVKFLLRQDSYPGVTAAELEFFKSQLRTSAYTCRLSSCPRATLGFESKELLREHEISHTRRFPCTSPECQYPPFVSVQSLRNHTKKYHSSNLAPRSIRRVGNLPYATNGRSTASQLQKPAAPTPSQTNKADPIGQRRKPAADANNTQPKVFSCITLSTCRGFDIYDSMLKN